MVNFRDPAKIGRDFCAYLLPSGPGYWSQPILVVPFHRDRREAVAHHRWPIHVSQPSHVDLQDPPSLTLRFSVGSFSLPLTTNGASFKGVVPTGGRYGSVAQHLSFSPTTELHSNNHQL